jgi:glycosyltransferase involved in cell wall biosynthesis
VRILQVNSILDGGGVDSQTLELSAGLAELGHRLLIATRSDARWLPLARAIPGVDVVTAQGSKPAWVRHLRRIATAFRADIVHAHHGRDTWTSVLGARLSAARPRVVITRHLMNPLSAGSAALQLRVAHVTAVSKAVYDGLDRQMRGPRSHLHLIYGGIDTDRFRPDPELRRAARESLGLSDDAIVFAVIGSYHAPRGKGQGVFLEAAARIAPRFPQARFLIVGHGELGSALQAQIGSLGLDGAARMLPFANDVERICAALDVLVHPAVGHEALGLVLWEAMASGRPVIGSALDGIPETFVAGEQGLLVAPDDTVALAAAMAELAGDADRRARMGAAARRHVVENGYTRAGHARRMAALYEKICAESPLWEPARP